MPFISTIEYEEAQRAASQAPVQKDTSIMTAASMYQSASPIGPAGSPPIDTRVAIAWLSLFDALLQGHGAYRSITGNRPDSGCACYNYAIDDPAERREVVRELCLNRGSYATIAFGLGALKQRPGPGRRGSGGDVAAVVTFSVDLDLKGCGLNKEAAREQAMTKSAALGLPITAIVDSGHGLHLYFMLRAPWFMVTDDDRLGYSERQRFLADAFGGDHICDLARVLRLPGTWNCKNAVNPLPCSVIYHDPAALTDPDLVTRLPKAASKQTPTMRSRSMPDAGRVELPTPPSDAMAGRLMARLKRLALADGSLRLALSPTLCCASQSHHDFAAICALLRAGLADGEALHVARAMRESREGAVTAKNARDDYWSSTLLQAHNTLT
jgi:hypothetical protein